MGLRRNLADEESREFWESVSQVAEATMRFWREDEPVDGSGHNVRDAARSLVDALDLTENQRTLLCHTFGNILPILAHYVDLVDGEELVRKLGRQVEHLQEIDAAIRAANVSAEKRSDA